MSLHSSELISAISNPISFPVKNDCLNKYNTSQGVRPNYEVVPVPSKYIGHKESTSKLTWSLELGSLSLN